MHATVMSSVRFSSRTGIMTPTIRVASQLATVHEAPNDTFTESILWSMIYGRHPMLRWIVRDVKSSPSLSQHPTAVPYLRDIVYCVKNAVNSCLVTHRVVVAVIVHPRLMPPHRLQDKIFPNKRSTLKNRHARVPNKFCPTPSGKTKHFSPLQRAKTCTSSQVEPQISSWTNRLSRRWSTTVSGSYHR